MRLRSLVFTLILFIPAHINAEALGIGPSIEPTILKKELRPIIDGLKRSNIDTQLVFSTSANDFLQHAKNRIDMTYVGAAYGTLFVQELGYLPLLVSDQKLQLVLISNQPLTYSTLNQSTGLTALVNRNDLLMMSAAKSVLGKNVTFGFYNANAHILFQVLQNKQHIGAVSYEEMALLPSRLMRKMHIVLKQETSPIYFMIHPRLKRQKESLTKIMEDFHRSWPEIKQAYPGVAYLNAYTFRRFVKSDSNQLQNPKQLQALKALLESMDTK